MGHDIRIHRQFYRLPLSILQKAKVAQVLQVINSGNIAKYKGQMFEDIDVNEEGKHNFCCIK